MRLWTGLSLATYSPKEMILSTASVTVSRRSSVWLSSSSRVTVALRLARIQYSLE